MYVYPNQRSRGHVLRCVPLYSAVFAVVAPLVFTQKHNHGPETHKLRQSRKGSFSHKLSLPRLASEEKKKSRREGKKLSSDGNVHS